MKESEKKLREAIKKIKELRELFENECCSISNESGNLYSVEQINFRHGTLECVNAISKLISERVILDEMS